MPYIVSRKELREKFVPYVKRFLREQTSIGKNLSSYDPIICRPTSDGDNGWAVICFEGTEWAQEFHDWFYELTGHGEFGYDWFEFEVFNSYEIGFKKVVNGNA